MAALIWNFDHVVQQVTLARDKLLAELRARNSEGAERVGISILRNVQEAYDAKSRKESAEDGIVWRDLSRATLEARVRRRAEARRIVEQRRQLASEIRSIRSGAAEPRSRFGKKAATSQANAIQQREKRRAELSAKMQALVDHESSAYEIGVDTGLQRSSGSPGFSDPVWNQAPSDAFGHNTFIVDAGRVTIGYDRTYSAAFDAQRELLPENLPDPWRVEAESAFSTWADQIIQSGRN